MAKRRHTPEDDYDRLAERIQLEYGRYITDAESFDRAYDAYLKDLPEGHSLFKKENRWAVREKLARSKPFLRENLFREAGGRDLQKDRLRTAKKVVTGKKDYIKYGARNVDLKGYDTRQDFNARFNRASRQKGRIVYVRQDSFKYRGREVTVFRDKLGRFCEKPK